MNKAAAAKVGASLVARKLMREIRARPGMPVWRTDDDGRRISLVITRAGRDAIGVAEAAAQTPPPVETRSAKRASASSEDWKRRRSQACPDPVRNRRCLSRCWRKTRARRSTALVEATGWLPHTTRAAITGLRKRGFAIERTRDEKLGSLYRIVGDQTASVGA